MAKRLAKHSFTIDDWAEVQSFDCGDEPFEQEVAEWLMGPAEEGVESALNLIADDRRECRVWLYKLGDKLVGFGALAKTEWRWPGKNKDPKLPLSIIIWVGIQKEYRGQPPGPRESRYAAQILDDLVGEAEVDARTHPVLGLFVHKDNKRAIKFYKDAGFSDELVQRVDKTTGEVVYYKMFIILDDGAFQEVVKAASK